MLFPSMLISDFREKKARNKDDAIENANKKCSSCAISGKNNTQIKIMQMARGRHRVRVKRYF